MNLKELPKIELHCHLDGSVRVDTIIDLMKKENMDLDGLDYEKIKKRLMVSEDCTSLVEYLERFELPLKLMQTKESLERITYELMEDAAKENIKYIEIRFAPILHIEKGLSLKEIIESVIKGLKRGEEDFDIKGGIILSILRHMDKKYAMPVIEAGKEFIGKGVVAIDLAGAENEGFVDDFVDDFKVGRDYGYNVTIHAGETGFSINVIESIEKLKATRIGHGIAILKDEKAYDLVKNENVILEMCPKSNVQTKAINTYEEHPIKRLLEDDIKASLCTDNRTVSNLILTDEYINGEEKLDLNEELFKKIYESAVTGAFCSEADKKWLMEQI
ncbi:adenosine deaminase [uncultured Clostridium sp.]|uniref:adenosine deaminase n=1 Tax=uncultured Clostridium sp. TaxID=59620 RepID=UPI002630DED9|nr:adenosine deaminase [uncultured Clostridium sp.]